MATVRDRGGKNRRGVGKSLYLSNEAQDLLFRISEATRRSESVIVSLLIESHGPALLADQGAGGKAPR